MSGITEVVAVTGPGVSVLPGSLQDDLASFGATLLPQTPGVSGPPDSTYWHLQVPQHQATNLISRLLESPEIEGAYVKPPDEAP